jgi:hypothetical protein
VDAVGVQQSVELRPGPAERDQCVVANPGNYADLAAVGEQDCCLVVDGCRRPERGRRYQRPVAGEVVAHQTHPLAGLAEDVARPDGDVVQGDKVSVARRRSAKVS